MKAKLSLAEELAAVDDDCESVGRPARNAHCGTRPTISAIRDKLCRVKPSTALRATRREPRGVERIYVRLRPALQCVAAGTPGRRVKRVNGFGHVVDEIASEVELDFVVAVSRVGGVVKRKWLKRVAEAACSQ